MVNDFWLKNKHTISIFQAQVRDLAKHIEAQPKKNNAYKKKTCIPSCQTLSNALEISKKTPRTSTVGFSSNAVCIS